MRRRNIILLLVILIVLGGYFYFFRPTEPLEEEEPQTLVWNINMPEIQHIEIRLPREGMSESFIQSDERDKFPWYFDNTERSEVDSKRWGGGIPLILSGPRADRVISKDTPSEKLVEFGLTQPQMEIIITMEDGYTLTIDVGDKSPDGTNYYVKAPRTNTVCLIDFTWYEVLENIVKDPPYANPPTN